MGEELDSRQRVEINNLLHKTFASALSDKPGRTSSYKHRI